MIIETEIEIAAPPMKVWRALSEFGAYPKWNPYREIQGVAALGEEVTMMIGPDPQKRHRLRATLSGLEPGRVVAFDTRSLLGRATESFILEPSRRGTRLKHRAEMSGLGVQLLGRKWFDSRLVKVYQRVDTALQLYVTRPNAKKLSGHGRRRRP